MRNVQFELAVAESIAHTYSVFARNLQFELPQLPGNVAFVADVRCGCRKDECYFCGALDDAIYLAVWEAEEAEYRDRYCWED